MKKTKKAAKSKRKFVQVGEVAVDTGQVVIVDPCHIGEMDYLDTCTIPDMKNQMAHFDKHGKWPKDKKKHPLTREIRDKLRNSTWPKGTPIAVVSESGIGDFLYPVYAEIVNDPQLGERVASLHIDFLL